MKKYWFIGTSILSSFLLVGCSTTPATKTPSNSVASVAIEPAQIIPSPQNLMAITSPQTNGDIFEIAGNSVSKGLYEQSLSTGTVTDSASISNHAVGISEDTSGMLAVGESTSSTGVVDIINTSSLKLLHKFPVGAPVISIATKQNGESFYVLNGTKKSESVTVIDPKSKMVPKAIAVSLGTLNIAVSQHTLYCLESNGAVEGISLKTAKPQFQFKAVQNPLSMVLGPSGGHLYILKEAGVNRNVSVINLQTESQTRVLPAPKGAVAISINPDGSLIYVGSSVGKSSNIQAFKTT